MSQPEPVTCERCRMTRAEGACCSSHGKHLCHECYRRTHFVEVCDLNCEGCRLEGLPVILRQRQPPPTLRLADSGERQPERTAP